MAEIKLTQAQRAVVEDRGGTLLVSAAAGSGKTKVLIDRLLSKVLSETQPHKIDDFLMITYTKAAAGELREKICAAMQERLAEEPGNRHLQRQMTRLYLAEISTVHAFCSGILREYAYLLDLPADFRVAEELECQALRQHAMEQSITKAYETMDVDFRAFADTLGGGRDDRAIQEIVWNLYEKAQTHRDPNAWLMHSVKGLEPESGAAFEETVWGAVLMQALQQFLEDAVLQMQNAAALLQQDPALVQAYLPIFEENIRQLQALQACKSWDEVHAAAPVSFGKLKAARKCEAVEEKEMAQAVRKDCQERLSQLLGYFSLTSAQALQELRDMAPAIRGAVALTQDFAAQYLLQKRRRHLLDFGDLEHEMLQLLYGKQGSVPTAAAREIAARYQEIMVDEYQDSNAVQDAIFHAISHESSRLFLVGDVKQSIYRFRLADPGIFIEKFAAFAPHETAQPGTPRKILLSENFRSREEILDAVNCVFARSMSERTGDVAYGPAQALRCGAAFLPCEEPAVELVCIGEDDLPAQERPQKAEVEAAFVAGRIAALLRQQQSIQEKGQTRAIKPGDIAILLRSPRAAAGCYLQALQRVGVPCFCDLGENLLQTTELQVTSALLEILWNPHQDIPLLSVLASPLFGFTASELAEIRAGGRGCDFFDALQQADTEKSNAFLRLFSALRSCAQQEELLTLYDEILEKTQLELIFSAMDGGTVRRSNLQQFRQLLVSHAQSGGDLASFVLSLQDLRARGLPGAAKARKDAVILTSIHKSKGLEYPVVFLAGLSTAFNQDDFRQPVLTHPALGIATNLVDRRQRIRYPSLAKQALARQLRREMVSEEMRVLYVAMTRAKERLIMSYCSDYMKTKLQRLVRLLNCSSREQAAASAGCLGDWVLLEALSRTEAGALHALAGKPLDSMPGRLPWRIALCEAGAVLQQGAQCVCAGVEDLPQETPADDAQLSAWMRFQYAHADCTLPGKLTATQMKGRGLDREVQEQAQVIPRPVRPFRTRPFLEQAVSPEARGSVMHLAMQFIRYAACSTRQGVLQELERLQREEFLTRQQAELVDPDEIVQFFASPLGQRILSAPEVRREFKFSILVDAERYQRQAAGEQVLLQGVTDCFLLEEDGITVIDFKTDHVTEETLLKRAAYYRGQLEEYAYALGRIFSRPVKEKILYFFAVQRAVTL